MSSDVVTPQRRITSICGVTSRVDDVPLESTRFDIIEGVKSGVESGNCGRVFGQGALTECVQRVDVCAVRSIENVAPAFVVGVCGGESVQDAFADGLCEVTRSPSRERRHENVLGEGVGMILQKR
jgi:hypothetical protein